MKKFYSSLILLLVLFQASAQFNGYFDPSNWTVKNSPGSNGQVIFDGAPDFVVISGSDGSGGSNKDTDLTIMINSPGRIRFSWDYHTNNSNGDPSFDIALVGINSTFTQITDNAGGVNQAGDYSSPILQAGTAFTIRIRSVDNARGNALLNVFNFNFTNVALPVKLLSFAGHVQDQTVMLEWKTGGEENFSHFELEHADESMNFQEIAAIFSSLQDNFSFHHLHPAPGFNLYRLKMVDKNGSFTYSKTISVKMADVMAGNLFPNPFSVLVNLDIKSSFTGKENISIINHAGQTVQQASYLLKKGSNMIQLNTNHLLPGYYTIRLGSSGQAKTMVKL